MADLHVSADAAATEDEVRAALRVLVANFDGVILLGERGQSCVAFLNKEDATVPARWTVDYPSRGPVGGPMRLVRLTVGWSQKQWDARSEAT